ncbi:hypothetical protein ACRALDRAFT_2025528 [Sodiomyces alcalophilus JCM 7366]|uniref:uncharacterized protein n=1 Tax=Sodiomyces alcalophilus JCM 7366 TaxID=591952 RepID=UPI0039B60F0D
MSPEALSSLFQHRPIRPLPKRRLRERLSPEVADSIEYPPSNQNSSPLFLYPGVIREEPSPSLGKNYTVVRDSGYEDGPGGNAEVGESDEDETKRFSNSKVVRRSHPEILNRAAAAAQGSKPGQSKSHTPQPPPSTASSVDGYDSFENTNNKKKRKIPTAGDSSLNGSHSLGDVNSIGVSGSTPPSNDADLAGMASPSYYGTGTFVSNSQGISGPGRGRFGRSRNGRSPLRALSDAANSWVGRGVKARPPQWPGSPNESSGIISSAIAKAEKLSASAGQENISLLHQPTSNLAKSRPTSAQFTFTCDSQVPGTQWPGTDPGAHASLSHSGYSGAGKSKHASMATQTGVDSDGVYGESNRMLPGHGRDRPSGKKKKNRCRGEKELRMAAARRRQEALDKYTHNPPQLEDIWICEFCEYERIFGVPPYALIRQYELKDQKVRRQEQERKRLLEKAKAKGRKARKAPKSPAKSTQSAHSNGHSHAMDHGSAGQSNTTDEEYPHAAEDDFDSYSLEDPPMLLSDDAGPDDFGAEQHDLKGRGHFASDRDRTGPDLKHHQYPPSGDPLRRKSATGGVAA